MRCALVTGVQTCALPIYPDVRRMLWRMRAQTEAARALTYYAAAQIDFGKLGDEAAAMRADILIPLVQAHATDIGCERSEERRVGKECVSTCRSRWSPYH